MCVYLCARVSVCVRVCVHLHVFAACQTDSYISMVTQMIQNRQDIPGEKQN